MEIFIKSSRYILGPVSQHFILKILDMSREWAVVGRPAWCHILGEKKVSTRSPYPRAAH